MRRMRHLKPREIQGCQLALDASIPTSLYDATSGGSLVAADGQVARIEDQSGNARHFVQGTSANRPLRRVASMGGCDSIELDGTSDFLAVGSTALGQNISSYTMLVVAIADTLNSQNSLLFIERGTGGSASRAVIYHTAAGLFGIGGRRLDADGFAGATSAGALSASARYCLSSVANYSTTTIKGCANGAEIASNTSWLTSGSTSDVAAPTSALGATNGSGGTTGWFDGKIGLAAMWHVALNDSVRRRMEHGNMRKWRING